MNALLSSLSSLQKSGDYKILIPKRLHAGLQDKGVYCWYALEALPIGAKIRVGIDEAIRNHDKLLPYDGTLTKFVNGQIVKMPDSTTLHVDILHFLIITLAECIKAQNLSLALVPKSTLLLH